MVKELQNVVSITTLTTLRWPSNKFILKGYDIHSNMITYDNPQQDRKVIHLCTSVTTLVGLDLSFGFFWWLL